MSYEESLEWLYASQQFGIKLGLENTQRLLDALGNPEKELACLHVAGTNGKGSTCALMDAVLRANGYKTGLYTSPHLVNFRERMRVNGKKIPEETVQRVLTQIRENTQGWEHSPTFFEITTALALRFFADENCQWVVLETGMGGRLDSTNAVTPKVSVIMPIALDHTQYLGNTLAEIAREKAGIIKPGVPVVSAEQEPEAKAVLLETARERGCALQFIDAAVEGAEIGLRGSHQLVNAQIALTALDAAGISLTSDDTLAGLKNVVWPGRFQIVQNRIVLDGSHNPHAIAHLIKTWREVFGEEKPTVIFGALADKDYTSMLKTLEPLAREFFFVTLQNGRTASGAELAASCAVPSRTFASVKEALAASPDRTLVTGSLFLVGEALEILGLEP